MYTRIHAISFVTVKNPALEPHMRMFEAVQDKGTLLNLHLQSISRGFDAYARDMGAGGTNTVIAG